MRKRSISRQKVIAALERNGFERLGEGFFSVVYAKPGSRTVIKLSNCDPERDGWFAFAKVAQCHRNKHFQHIYKVVAVKNAEKPFYMAVMERLHPWRNGESPLSDTHETHRSAMSRAALDESQERSLEPEMRKAVQILRRKLFKHWSVDMHRGNFLVRKNRDGSETLVITDPVSFKNAA